MRLFIPLFACLAFIAVSHPERWHMWEVSLAGWSVRTTLPETFPTYATSIIPLGDSTTFAGPNIIRIPFTLTGGLITIRARVDTLEGNFFFDTGAEKLLLNERYFSKGGASARSAGGVTGNVAVLGTVKVDTLQFDNFLATKLQADVINLNHLENAKKIALVGLLGAEVFEGYEIVFDYEMGLLILVRTDGKGAPIEPLPSWEYAPAGSFPLKTTTHIGMIYLDCGGKDGRWMGLDSGAEQNLLSHATNRKFLKNNFEIRRRIKLKGAGSESLEVLSGMLLNTRLDTFSFQPMATLLTKMALINAVYEGQLDGVLGYEFLSQYPMGVNLRRKKLTLYKRVMP